MSKYEKTGTCRICGKESKLTFEHIPPNKAHNNKCVKVLTEESFIKLTQDPERLPWERDRLPYYQLQKGMGLYSLCESCNNNTGAYYGEEYVNISNRIVEFFITNKHEAMKNNYVFIKMNIHPLRFIKQVLSMFCSTIPGLIEEHPEIKDLLLIKEKRIMNPDFKISMCFLRTEIFLYSGTMIFGLKNGTIRKASCLYAYPFLFVFDYDKSYIDDRMIDITSFLSFDYDNSSIIDLSSLIVEHNIIFPLDFRTKEEYFESKKNGC